KIFSKFAGFLVIPPVVLWFAFRWNVVSIGTSSGFWVLGFFVVCWAGILASLAWLLFSRQPGLILDSVGIRSTMPLRGLDPGLIPWSELAGARPTRRLASGQVRWIRGAIPLWHVDLQFRDPEKFLSRLGAGQERYRTPYYRAFGIPYAICVE